MKALEHLQRARDLVAPLRALKLSETDAALVAVIDALIADAPPSAPPATETPTPAPEAAAAGAPS
jgi:hypothetical protein